MSDFSTRALQVPHEPTTGSVVAPIFQTSTYGQVGVAELRGGYEYSRVANPTRTVLQDQLAALEGAAHAFALPSGLAANDIIWRALLRPGRAIVLPNDVYGGTFRLADKVFRPWGCELVITDPTDLDRLRRDLNGLPPGSTLWLETPSNPMLRITDLEAACAIAREAGVTTVVDSTVASPYLQRPLALGADVVLHSTTKFIAGHSDALGGALLTDDDDLAAQLAFLQNAAGSVPGPMDSWLTTRGVKTLAVRMERHGTNAQAVAEHLAQHPAVAAVHYPGLPGHPHHDVAARQMSGFGGMLSFEVAAGPEAAARVVTSTQIFTLAESLGGVESLIEVPAQMTHLAAADSAVAPPPNLVRLSVGLEGVEDLIGDLDEALSKVDRIS